MRAALLSAGATSAATVLATIVGLLLGLGPPQAIAAVPSRAGAAYAYDSPIYIAPDAERASERVPPSADATYITYDAVDIPSHGNSARSDRRAAPATTTYDYSVELVQVARAATTTGAEGGMADREFSSFQRRQVAANGVGSGSGPWMEGITATRGGAVAQSRGGSCVSACGSMLSNGARTEAQLLDELGEWSNPGALADALGSGWSGHYFASSADAVTAAGRGPMGAVLQAPGASPHMVVTSPLSSGRFMVRDPWAGGSSYEVASAWIERFVAGGTYR